MRHKLNGLNAKKFSNRLSDEGPIIDSRSKMLEIIDTTLLKCYLQTNAKGLVASLLRLKVPLRKLNKFLSVVEIQNLFF